MKRYKRELPKFLEIEDLERLEKPIVDEIKMTKAKEVLNSKEKIAIRDFAVLTLVYSCALRISEALNLELHNINFKKQYMIIYDSKGDDRMVSIPAPVIGILQEWLKVRPDWKNNNYLFCNVKGTTKPSKEGKPLGRDYYNKLISKLADITGVRMAGGGELVKPHPHTLRHTRAVNLRDHGVELDVIQQILGHRNISTTQVYAKVRNETINKVQQDNLDGIVNI